MKNVQLFIHRYYDTIKLLMLSVLLILGSITIVNQLESKARQDAQSDKAVKDIIRSLQAESESQTDIINRQFKALCVIIIQTSGQEGLNQLDGQTQERCRNLASNNFELDSEDEVTLEAQDVATQKSPAPVTSTPSTVSPQPTGRQSQAQSALPSSNGSTVLGHPALETLYPIINIPRRVTGE